MKDWLMRLAKMPVRFWLQVAVVILSIVPIAYICMRMSSSPEYPLALTFVFLAIASEAVLFVFPEKKFSGYLAILCVIFLALAACYFLCGGVLSVVDYIYGIKLFGDASQFSAILGYGIVMVVGTIVGIVCCFFVKD